MVMICDGVKYDGDKIKPAGDHRGDRDEARARLSSPPLYTSRECSVMKVRTSDDGNFGRRARFRRATREDGDGGRATREDDDGRGRASRGETLWGRPDRARGSRASVARARARTAR